MLVYDPFETIMRPVKMTEKSLEDIGGLCYLEKLMIVHKKRKADEMDDDTPVVQNEVTWYTTCFSLVNEEQYVIVWITNYPFATKHKCVPPLLPKRCVWVASCCHGGLSCQQDSFRWQQVSTTYYIVTSKCYGAL